MSERNNGNVIPGFQNIEATVGFETVLVDKLNNQYPPATKPADLYIPGTQQATFASFDLRQKQAGDIVARTLRLSADPSQSITFCHHANQGHLAFAEAVEWISRDIKSPNSQVLCMRQIDIARDRPSHRLRLTTEDYQEKVFHPPPTIANILKELNPLANSSTSPRAKQKIIAKHLRSLVVGRGLGFAMVVATHLCMPPKEISDVLSFQGIKKNDRPDNCFKPGNKQHRQALHRLRKILITESRYGLFPSRSSQDFDTAVAFLRDQGIVRTGIEIATIEDRKPLPYKFKPVAVLCGMMEKAYELASDKYLDPRKTTFITENYLDRYTTQVITAYFEFHPHTQMIRW